MEMAPKQSIESEGVRILELRFLRGPNIYAYMPVMLAVLDTGPYNERPSSDFTHLIDRMTTWLPGLEKHQCSLGRPGGFLDRLRRGTYLAHISEHVALELQQRMGFKVTFGRARGHGEPGVFNVIMAYREEAPAQDAFRTAVWLTLAAMNEWHVDIEGELSRLERLANRHRLGPSTASIVRAARRRDIPVRRLTATGSLVQLGYGVHQKRIRASETTCTSAIAVDICQDKPLTNTMLKAVGVPVPAGGTVSSADEAWKIAQEVGLPVVVKPEAGNQGKGVSVNLSNEDDVRSAYLAASAIRGKVLVERYIEGIDYRLLVVNGKMIAAACRAPAEVTGDGIRTIEQLVEQVNKDPRRSDGHSGSLTRITLDALSDRILSKQGLHRTAIPESGRSVMLRSNSNLSTGGTATDVTDSVHHRNAQIAELAAQILDLDVAGIDVICKDIGQPLGVQGGAIVEVNAAPGLRMHSEPSNGDRRDIGSPIVEMLYPNGAPSRIPIVAVTGTNGKTTVTRLIAHMHQTARKCVGMTSTDGAYIAGELVLKGDSAGPQSARTILMHPRVEVAVLETARGGILREGLAFDTCAVGVVTNVSEDHLGLRGVQTIEDLARVKQVVVEAVPRNGVAVLNAQDRRVAEMAAATDGEVIYFSADPDDSVIKSHVAQGGRCVLSDGSAIVCVTGESERSDLVELERLAFAKGGKLGFQVQNALAAVAAAWALGLNPALIARALSTFTTDPDVTPGRFNIFDIGGVEVILDYAHNPAAMTAFGEAVNALGRKRTYALLCLPGDRRDEDLAKTVAATLRFTTDYVLYDGKYRRGRGLMEMPRLLASKLPPHARRELAETLQDAVDMTWSKILPGERLIIFPETVDEALAAIEALRPPEPEASCKEPITEELVAVL